MDGHIAIPEEDVVASYPCYPLSAPAASGSGAPGSWRRKAVARGMQKTFSKTSMLVNFLPTGTLLTFKMLLPSASGDGSCSPVSTMMIYVLLSLCAVSCFFFIFMKIL